MAETKTVQMLEAYISKPQRSMFLSSLFKSGVGSFHNSSEVEYHLQKNGLDVAVPLTNVSDGYRQNQTGGFVGKKVAPPTYKEAETFEALSLMGLQLGKSKYDAVDFNMNAMAKIQNSMDILQEKIRRSMELQASQIFTTGAINLKDSNNTTVFAESFGALSSHFANSSYAWNNGSADPISDIMTMCDKIQADSNETPKDVIFGAASFETALLNANFKARFTNLQTSINLGYISPEAVSAITGAQMVGTIWAGGYWLNCYVYNGAYKNPYQGTITKYVPDDKVIIHCNSRMDATFGGLPKFGQDQRALSFLPSRMSNVGGSMDIMINSWVNPDGETMTIGFGSRPLLIPVCVNSFGCIDTQI